MQFILILLSVIGIGMTLYKNYMREYREDAEPEKLKENHPVAHIKSILFLEVPLEKIVMGYFIVIALAYAIMPLFNISLPELDLAVLLLSGVIILLLIYNLVMVLGITERFSWRVFVFLILSIIISALVFYRLDEPIEALLFAAFPYTLTIHILGLVLGFGGALILDMMIFHFLRNFKISTREAVIMHLISQMIVLGLILLIVSGIALVFTDLDRYLQNPRFLMKMTGVFFVLVNGVVLNLYVAPKMEMISLREEDRKENQTLVNVSFIVGAISFISWFSVFVLAMINVLEAFSYGTLLLMYLILLALAIGAGLITKRRYEKVAKEEQA